MHFHINTMPNYIAPIVASALADSVSYEDFYEQGILNVENGVSTNTFTVDRDSRFVMCGTKFKQPELIHSVVQTIVTQYIEPNFQCNVRCWETPQLLMYPENGGHYKPHVDGELCTDGVWERVTNRHLTLLIYLDEDYTGGDLVFPDYGITMRPKIGQIVVFPSSRHYKHGVLPLESGTRRVLVCWLIVWGQPIIKEVDVTDSRITVNGKYSTIVS